MGFVFLAIDAGSAKRVIVEALESFGASFVDCGMGLYRLVDSLGGILRVTTSTDGHRSHVGKHVSFADDDDDEYDLNIQTGDLNMLNAAVAVIKWKKLVGYYIDRKQEYHSTYTVGRNQLLNSDLSE